MRWLIIGAVVVAGAAGLAVALATRGTNSSLATVGPKVRSHGVLTGPASEEGPVSGPHWFGWMESGTPNPIPPASRTIVYARPRGGRAFRVNPPGTYAQTGGLTGDTLFVQIAGGLKSDLAAVNLRTRALERLPRLINTPAWEWRPSASGRWLLFGRIHYETRTYDVLLANLRTRTVQKLSSVSGHAAYAAPGQVNGDYAVWIDCPDNHCRAYRYDIRRRQTIAMPPLGGYHYAQFGPSVSRAGVVYFGLARDCDGARLMRFDHGRVTALLRFPDHHAFQYSYVDDTSAGVTKVFFDQVGCERSDLSDIRVVVDSAPSPPRMLVPRRRCRRAR